MAAARLIVSVSVLVLSGCDSEYAFGDLHGWDGLVIDASGEGAGEASPGRDPVEIDPADPADPNAGTTGPGTDRLEPDPVQPVPDTGLAEEDDACLPGMALTGYLDDLQTAADGAVSFCHSGSGGPYHIVDTSVAACLPHLSHPYDVFPTTGCDS
jgi:hypothetical protein